MRPYKVTIFRPFQTEKSSLKSLMLVGAHGNAPDDELTQDRTGRVCVGLADDQPNLGLN
jgi:hypothetical protein